MVEEGWTTAEIIERVLTLMRKMDAEELHVLANTAWLASERLRKLEHFLLAERERCAKIAEARIVTKYSSDEWSEACREIASAIRNPEET